jgi:fatty-acyl-CoA synthase
VSELTLSALLSRAAEDRAGELALIERDGELIVTLTFAELLTAVTGLAGELRARGVRRGDVVGVWLPNWSEMIVWEFALAALGAAALGINTRYSVHELTDLLQRGRPVGVVAPAAFLDLEFSGRLRSAFATAGDVAAPWVAVARAQGSQHEEFDLGAGTWASGRGSLEHASHPHGSDGRPTDPVNYFTTSGSTGLPKLAGHDQASLVSHCRNVATALDMRPGDRFLGVLPLSGVFGFNPAMAMLSAGGACLLEPVFTPDLVLADMDAHAVTHVVGGDDMLGRLMDAWKSATPARGPRLGRLRRGGIADFSGRARAVVEWAQRELGVAISGVYGSSELFSLASIWDADLGLDERSRPGGTLVSGDLSVRAVDPESGEPCAPNTDGELQFRGYNVVCGYLGDPDVADEAFTGDGWFRSGDLGFALPAPDSFVYVCRAGDALRLRGFLVEPAEIEQFLASHPDVATAKVVGVRSSGGGDVAVAYVQLVDGATTTGEQLLEFCRARLAHFKVPSQVNVIDEFPVTTGTNGTKIRTAELRRWAEEQLYRDQPAERRG